MPCVSWTRHGAHLNSFDHKYKEVIDVQGIYLWPWIWLDLFRNHGHCFCIHSIGQYADITLQSWNPSIAFLWFCISELSAIVPHVGSNFRKPFNLKCFCNLIVQLTYIITIQICADQIYACSDQCHFLSHNYLHFVEKFTMFISSSGKYKQPPLLSVKSGITNPA